MIRIILKTLAENRADKFPAFFAVDVAHATVGNL